MTSRHKRQASSRQRRAGIPKTKPQASISDSSKKKCSRVTKLGKPCSKYALPGGDFCWLHYSRGYKWSPTVIGIIVSVGLTVWGGVYFYKKSETFTERMANIQRARELPTLRRFPFNVVVGGAEYIVTGPGRYPGLKYGSHRIHFSVTPERSLLIDVEIRNETGAVVAEVKNSKLSVTGGARYDVNSDRMGYEVVDETLVPILQIDVKGDRGPVYVNFFAYWTLSAGSGYRTVVCHEERGCVNDIDPSDAKKHFKRVFKYPGHEYPGIRVEN